jgi:predicted permease
MRWQFWKSGRSDQDFADEVASTLELEAERLTQRGVPPSEAADAARRAFGNVGRARERFYESERAMFLDRLAQDVRYGLRTMGRNPGFAAVAMLTIGLAIGINAAAFSIFDAIALRPFTLPGTRPVLGLYQTMRGGPGRAVNGEVSLLAYPEYTAYRDQAPAFSGLAAYVPEFNALLEQDPQPVASQLSSCNYFEVLEVQPALGRGFVSADCAADGDGAVAVLSHETWQRQFASSPTVLGRTIRVNRVPLTIVGVAPPGFHGTELVPPAFWAPLTMHWRLSGQPAQGSSLADQNLSWLAVVGRLSRTASAKEAATQMAVIAGRLDRRYAGRTTTVTLHEPTGLASPDKRTIGFAAGAAFLLAVGLVLLIACVNVANLFLVRAAARRREIALRLATGASRGRIIRQLVTESLLVAAGGGAIGTVAAVWGAKGLMRWVLAQPGSTPLALNITPDLRIMAYALFLTVGTGLFFGLVPALHATRTDLTQALKQEHHDPDTGRSKLRGALLGVQVTACLTLLLVAGLMLRGLMHVTTVDPGLSTDHVTHLTFNLQREGYTEPKAQAFHAELVRRLAALPGVDVVTEAAASPLGGNHLLSPFGARPDAMETTEVNSIDDAYFTVLGVPFVRGRGFTGAEVRSGAKLVVLNEAAARHFFPGADPLGKVVYGYPKTEYVVTGVVRDAEYADLGSRHTPFLFLAALPTEALTRSTVLIHANVPPATAEALIRGAVLAIDPDLHFTARPLAANLQSYVDAGQALAVLSGALGGLALVLATIGIYGTVAYTVTRRTREIGIRMALGAEIKSVVSLILRQTMRPVVWGAVIGTALTAAVSRALAPVLFGVSPWDAFAFGGVLLVLGTVAACASYIPARRAARVDPTIALRSD